MSASGPSGPLVICLSLKSQLIVSLISSPLLITFANSLDPDQAQQNVWPDLNPNCLTL